MTKGLKFTSLLLLLFYCSSLLSIQVETFYGKIEVDEPVLVELIESPAFQRLKDIHQYGVAYYTTHNEEYTRYDHSLGVFALLRKNERSLEEQIAGLLHDIAHTIFSHVGDYIFKMDHHELTQENFLNRSGVSTILNKYGYSVEQILPKQENFPALEQKLPTLCADRIDYNLQGAFYQNFISKQEAIQIYESIKFINGDWISDHHDILKKLVRFTIFMSKDCWGSGTGYVLSTWLTEAILRGVEIGIMTVDDIHFGRDQEIWNRLLDVKDPVINTCMHKILHRSDYHEIVEVEEADIVVRCKYRGIDPWVVVNGKKVRLSETDPVLADEFLSAKKRMEVGWGIKYKFPN